MYKAFLARLVLFKRSMVNIFHLQLLILSFPWVDICKNIKDLVSLICSLILLFNIHWVWPTYTAPHKLHLNKCTANLTIQAPFISAVWQEIHSDWHRRCSFFTRKLKPKFFSVVNISLIFLSSPVLCNYFAVWIYMEF